LFCSIISIVILAGSTDTVADEDVKGLFGTLQS
jgi:hypothetical protein